MHRDQLTFDLGPGPICEDCRLMAQCGASYDESCLPDWGPPAQGGVNVLHPRNPDTWAYLDEVGGPELDRVVALPQQLVALSSFVHHIRPLRALRGQLTDPVYVVGPSKTISTGVMSCQRVREIAGLAQAQALGLVLFGRDHVLERLWARRREFVPAIAAGAYDFCVAPSFSNYLGRPRTEYLYNAKRSLGFFELLQDHGVTTVPRVAWINERDAAMFARWAEANRSVGTVALDIPSSSPAAWDRELRLLARFDDLTAHRLSFIVHGPSVLQRFLDLYRLLGATRVHVTNARAIARPAAPGTTYRERFETERAIADSALRIATTTDFPACRAEALSF